MKLKQRSSKVSNKSLTVGTYKLLKSPIFFADGTCVPVGSKVRILKVALLYVRIQIPAKRFAVGVISHSRINW